MNMQQVKVALLNPTASTHCRGRPEVKSSYGSVIRNWDSVTGTGNPGR